MYVYIRIIFFVIKTNKELLNQCWFNFKPLFDTVPTVNQHCACYDVAEKQYIFM